MGTMAVLMVIMLIIIMVSRYDLYTKQLEIKEQINLVESALRVLENDISRQQMEIKTQLNKIEVELHLIRINSDDLHKDHKKIINSVFNSEYYNKKLLALIDDLGKELKKQIDNYTNIN